MHSVCERLFKRIFIFEPSFGPIGISVVCLNDVNLFWDDRAFGHNYTLISIYINILSVRLKILITYIWRGGNNLCTLSLWKTFQSHFCIWTIIWPNRHFGCLSKRREPLLRRSCIDDKAVVKLFCSKCEMYINIYNQFSNLYIQLFNGTSFPCRL